jgi:hypothetical protein
LWTTSRCLTCYWIQFDVQNRWIDFLRVLQKKINVSKIWVWVWFLKNCLFFALILSTTKKETTLKIFFSNSSFFLRENSIWEFNFATTIRYCLFLLSFLTLSYEKMLNFQIDFSRRKKAWIDKRKKKTSTTFSGIKPIHLRRITRNDIFIQNNSPLTLTQFYENKNQENFRYS